MRWFLNGSLLKPVTDFSLVFNRERLSRGRADCVASAATQRPDQEQQHAFHNKTQHY